MSMEIIETYDTMILWYYAKSQIDEELLSVSEYKLRVKSSDTIFITVNTFVTKTIEGYSQSYILPMPKAEYIRMERKKKFELIWGTI